MLQLIGERGYIVGKRPEHLIFVNGSGTQYRKIDPVDAFLAELRAFAGAIGSPVPVGLPAGTMSQAIISAAETSAKRRPNWVEVTEFKTCEDGQL